MPEASAPVCVRRRLSQRLAAIAFVAVSPLVSVSWAAPPAVCQVALPDRCDGPTADRTHPLVVRTLAAANADECFARAREAAAGCSTSRSVADDVVARFAAGAIERRRKVLANGAPAAPAAAPNLPIVYDAGFGAEFEQYGYSPGFAPGVPSVDSKDRLLVRSGPYLQRRSADGAWTVLDLSEAATRAIRQLADVRDFQWISDYRNETSDQAVYSDAKGVLYTLVQGSVSKLGTEQRTSNRPYLLASADDGVTWQAAPVAVPDERDSWRATIEHNDANSFRGAPPPVLLFDKDLGRSNRSQALFLILFDWDGARLSAQPALRISDRSILTENHSGGSNSVVSTKESIFVVYPATRSAGDGSGTPAYLVVVDRMSRKIRYESHFSDAGAAAAVDDHNIPGICVGAGRTLHVLLPGHQEELRFLSGQVGPEEDVRWGQAQRVGEAAIRGQGAYTYGSLNCAANGVVSIVSRWAGDKYRFQLVLLQRRSDQGWRSWNGKRHMVIVDPGRPFYGAWRQQVAQDAKGRLYLYYSYYANQLSPAEHLALQRRFPFEDWAAAKEVQPLQCVKGAERRCFEHPLPQLTNVILSDSDDNWSFVR